MENDNQYTRKDFLKTAGSTALFTAFGIGFYGCDTTDSINGNEVRPPSGGIDAIDITNNGNTITIDLSKESVFGLNQQGGWMLIRDTSTLVVNINGSTIRAFTSICTHAGCSTNWRFADRRFECTCHGSRFDTGGSVVRGPATRDLQEFSVSRDGDLIVISK